MADDAAPGSLSANWLDDVAHPAVGDALCVEPKPEIGPVGNAERERDPDAPDIGFFGRDETLLALDAPSIPTGSCCCTPGLGGHDHTGSLLADTALRSSGRKGLE